MRARSAHQRSQTEQNFSPAGALALLSRGMSMGAIASCFTDSSFCFFRSFMHGATVATVFHKTQSVVALLII